MVISKAPHRRRRSRELEMTRRMLEEMRLNLVNELGRLYDAGYDLSSPIVIQVAEVLDEVVDQIMEYELKKHCALRQKEDKESDVASVLQ